MTYDLDAVTERLAAQPVAEKVIRNQLISEGYSIREATARAGGVTRRRDGTPRAARQRALAEAVAAAVQTATAARKAAKKAAKRATAEAAAARVIQERQQLAARFSDSAIAESLREASSDDLAVIIATAQAGAGRRGPMPRPAAEVTGDPQAMTLDELDRAVLASTATSAGASPFWGGRPAGGSPFWRGLQPGEGTAGA